MSPDRRDFLRRAALAAMAGATTGATAATGDPSSSDVQQAGATPLDPRALEALAEAVLPETLGATGQRDAARAFGEWVRQYPAGAEEMHGYGYAEITLTPEDPGPRWAAQVAVLDRQAADVSGGRAQAFRDLDVASRREVVARVLARVSGPRLPANPHDAPHVAIALMAHWASTPAAVDLAYGARIGRSTCGRPLAENPRQPLPVAPERR